MAKPYTIVYQHTTGSEHESPNNVRRMVIGMAGNHDIHIKVDAPGIAAVSHVFTMADFDEAVEKIHAFHAEVEVDPNDA